MRPNHHRSLFLSDLHLGALGCRADLVRDFLEKNTADQIFLVGDILDIWHPLAINWGPVQDQILEILRQRAAEGAELVYLIGNHDYELTKMDSCPQIPARLCREYSHRAADGRLFLILHGDICDSRMFRWHIWTRIGSRIDSLLRSADRGLRRLRRSLRPEDRTPIEWAIAKLNEVLYAGQAHERRLIELARRTGHDGVVCGHFHVSALHSDHGLIYANCGDWVDSFTAIAEDADGRLHMLGGREVLRAGRPAPDLLAGEVA
ncbi:MAG: UDP-2,3-diacylglucosamine diphosphatase [Gemmobacter sp.]